MRRWNELSIKQRATYGFVAPFLAVPLAYAAAVALEKLGFRSAGDAAIACIMVPSFALHLYARMMRCPQCDRRVTGSLWRSGRFPPDACPDCEFSFRDPNPGA